MRTLHARLAAPALLLALLVSTGCPSPPPRPAEPTPAPPKAGPPGDDAVRFLNLGVCSLEQFRYQEAIGHFESALERSPGWLAAEVDLAIAHLNDLLDEAHAEKAVAAADRALAQAPGDLRASYVKAYALSEQLRSFDEALPLLRGLVEAAPEDPHAWYQLGRTALESGEVSGGDPALAQEAEAAFRHALELDPRFSEANYKLARLLVDADDEARQEEGLELLQKHQELVKGRPPVQQNYLTRGELARVWPFVPPPPKAAPRNLVFRASEGLDAPPFRGAEPHPGLSPARYRHGLTVGDFTGDGRLDLLSPRREVDQPVALLWGQGPEGGFGQPLALGLQGSACGAAPAGDFDRDGDLDAFVACNSGNALLLNEGGGVFRQAPDAQAAGSIDFAALTATAVDFDHDGDLDLHLLAPAGGQSLPPPCPQHLFRNDGTASFTLVEDRMGLPENLLDNRVLWSDFDGDNAVDLLGVGAEGPTLFRNDRSGHFETLPLAAFVAELAEAGPGTVRWAVFDPDGDEDLDLAMLASAGGPQQLIVLENQSVPGRPLFRACWAAPAPEGSVSLRALDLDLDGATELVLLGSAAWPSGEIRQVGDLRLSGGLQPLLVRLVHDERLDPKHAAPADLDGDGDLDLAVLEARTSRPFVLWNELEPGAGFAYLSARGRAERSNPQGFGAKLTVDSGSLRQYREVHGLAGYMSHVVAPQVFGLGDREGLDTVSVLWPSGIRQAECGFDGRSVEVIEIDRQPSSCPMLYAWDGGEWRFQSDCFDTAPLGLWVAPGVHVAGDPDELYRLREDAFALEDGVVNLLVAEFLNESLLADRTSLIAVDLEPGRSLVADEGVRLATPPPEVQLWSVGPGEAPRAARVDGRDATRALSALDRQVAGWSEPTGLLGLAHRHSLELDLAESEGLLVLTGSLNFANSTNLYAAHQRGLGLEPVRLELRTAAGGWKELSPDAGAPAGFHKDLVVDLRALGLAGPATVRLTTNMQVSWDRAALHRDARPLPFGSESLQEVPLIRAEKRWLGIPREVQGPENRWREFPLDEGLVGRSDWVHQGGAATPDGDVRDLLGADDMELAIVRPGEAIELGFDASALPPAKDGEARAFVFSTRGWVKDADPHTLHSATIEPLPVPGQPLYP